MTGGAWQPALVPADWEATDSFFRYPIAIRTKGGALAVAKPVRRDFSQSGLRGVWYFALDDVDMLVYLRQSCTLLGGPYAVFYSRHRWVETAHCYLTPEKCEKIVSIVEEVWKRGGDVDDVIRAIETASLLEIMEKL